MSEAIGPLQKVQTWLFSLAILVTGTGLFGCSQASIQGGADATPITLLPIPSKPGIQQGGTDLAGHLIFVSNRDGRSQIYMMNADGTNTRRMTTGEGEDAWPSFSPDGKLILYESTINGRAQIYVTSADGQNLKNLTGSQSSDEFPAWSPDGSRIVFTSDRGGHVGIYVMNADGSGAKLLTDNPSNNWFPVWSPNGSTIAFISDRDGSSGNIFLMDPAGNHLNQVTAETNLVAKPSWAPDSQHLAVFNRGGFFEITREGDKLTPITSDGEDPAWSPDGKWIAFASRRDAGRLQIYLVRPDGSSVRRITNSSAEDWEPAWGP